LSVTKKKTIKGSGRKKGKSRINIGPRGEIGKFKTGGKDEASQKSCSGVIEILTDEESEEDGEGSEKSGWKSDGKGSKSLPEIRGETDEPKKERRFVRVYISIIMHENPVSPFDHLSCDLGIAGLIRVPEVPLTQVNKINNKTESYEKSDLSPFLGIEFGKTSLHRFLSMKSSYTKRMPLLFQPNHLGKEAISMG